MAKRIDHRNIPIRADSLKLHKTVSLTPDVCQRLQSRWQLDTLKSRRTASSHCALCNDQFRDIVGRLRRVAGNECQRFSVGA